MAVLVSPVLSAHDLVKVYGERRVLDGLSFSASPGQRIGLIGENGAGKSTLLRLLAGVEEPDAGEVVRPVDIGFLQQEMAFPGHATVADVLDDALAELRAMQAKLDEISVWLQQHPDDEAAIAHYGEILDWAVAHDLWDADRRADLVLAGLDLAGVDRSRRIGTLSGGERSRLGLAALLIRQPRALLLDEPTNHLDDRAIGFVEAHLTRMPGLVVVASHDRVLLDAVCTDIVDLDPSRSGVTRYGGAYSDYLTAKQIERRKWEEQYAAEQEQIHALQLAVRTTARRVAPNREPPDRNKIAYDRHGGRVEAQVSRRVRNAQRRLDELSRRQVRKPPAPLRFRGLNGDGRGALDGVAVSLRGVSVPGRLYVDELDVPADGHLLVEGPNGSGKSTLLAVLAGTLRSEVGTLWRRRGLSIGLLEQDVAFPDPTRTARQIYEAAPGTAAVPLTDLGLVAPRDIDRPVGVLSVGQRRRLALALLIARTPHLLLLDEPTNHISLTLAEELEEALRTAPGAVVVASHDRWLRRRWHAARLRLTADHRIAPDAGSLLASLR
ncbi:MAG TPA: ABC-F family ATP-binding cassette domain-containing protein [Micromonosporaceae bacterium]|nr:ABC-F family ATP-binding cassette domain-containing protein [Micromonosporaceae bacterium]